jgi:hypothetical protein
MESDEPIIREGNIISRDRQRITVLQDRDLDWFKEA